MERRTFLTQMLKSLKVMLFMGLMPPTLATGSDSHIDTKLHYRPLNGTDIHDIARRKLHHGKGRFFNPFGLPRDGRWVDLLKWKLFSFNEFSDSLKDQPKLPLTVNWEAINANQGLSITFLKHAGLLIKDHGTPILIDPVFEDIFWFIKDFSPLAFKIQDIPRPEHILITHGHYDHLDLPSLSHFDKNIHVISPLGYGEELDSIGLRHRTQLDWFDSFTNKKQDIKLLPCNHWTMRNPIDGPNTSLWGSYLIRTTNGYTIFVSGDTAYFDGYEQIGAAFDIDLAIFNLGAYEPRWFMAQSHINPMETVQAFKEMKAKKLMVVHWGTFQLGDEPVHFPPIHIRRELEKEGLLDKLVDLKHGETFLPG